jgi:hypothetical protein
MVRVTVDATRNEVHKKNVTACLEEERRVTCRGPYARNVEGCAVEIHSCYVVIGSSKTQYYHTNFVCVIRTSNSGLFSKLDLLFNVLRKESTMLLLLCIHIRFIAQTYLFGIYKIYHQAAPWW